MFINFLFICILSLLIKSIKSLANCTEGENFCLKCNPITKLCEDCEYNVFIPDNKGGCKGSKTCKSEYNHCSQCDSDNKLCQKCENNYIPDENGGCSLIENCEVSYKGSCLKCIEDFILVGTAIKLCKSLDSIDFNFCKEIDIETGFCKTCEENWYLDDGDNLCSTYENCYESLFGVCIKCNESFYLDIHEGKCKLKDEKWINCEQTLDGKTCYKCEKNYFFDNFGNCTSIKYCSESGKYEKCEKCNEGYYLLENGELCTKEPKCSYGDKTLGICRGCQRDYYIDFKDGTCKPNNLDNDFKYCKKADGECYECNSDTYLGEDKKCSFSKNCVESYLGNCTHCVKDYHLGRDNICTNVDKCVHSSRSFTCDECELGYYYNSSSEECMEEIPGLENCQILDDLNRCTQCRIDFYINKTDYLCYSNLENNDFYKCALTYDGETCYKCIENYYLGEIDNKCTKIEGCQISENENRCIQCNTDIYCLNKKTGWCMYNQAIENEDDKIYFNCNMTNNEGNKCELCLNGFRVNNKGFCEYEEYCKIFDDEQNHCTQCIDNVDDEYEYANYCLNDDIGCVLTYAKWCNKCNNIIDLDFCTECYDGYKLDNGECFKIE